MTVMPDHSTAANETGLSRFLSHVDRQQAVKSARRHSAIVKTLRVAFPLVAIAAASLYLFNAKLSFSVANIDAQFEKVEVSSEHLKIVKPRLQGFNDKHGGYVVNASQALQSIKNPDEIQLSSIDAKVTNSDNGWTKIVATSGTYHSKKEFLNLRDGIKVTSSAGMEAVLEAADIDMKKQLITAKTPVAVKMTNGTVHSTNMEIATSIRKIIFSNAVRVHLVPPKKSAGAGQQASKSMGAPFSDPDKPIDISADRLEILDEDKLAAFSGSVTADQGGLKLKSDRLRIRYEGRSNSTIGATDTSITTIEARDNVVMTAPKERKATSDWSILDNRKNLATLGGNVTLYQGENRLHGQKLLFDLKTRHTIFPAGERVKGRFIPEKSAKSVANAAEKSPKPAVGSNIATSFAGLGANNGKPIFVEADRLDIFDEANRAIFRGNVDVEQGGYRLYSEELEMMFSGSRKSAGGSGGKTNVSKIIAADKVRLISPDGQRVTSNKATYDVKTNFVTIDGNVVLTRGKDIIKGDQLTIDLTTNRSWVKNHGKAGAKRPVRMLLGPRKLQKDSAGSANGSKRNLEGSKRNLEGSERGSQFSLDRK